MRHKQGITIYSAEKEIQISTYNLLLLRKYNFFSQSFLLQKDKNLIIAKLKYPKKKEKKKLS